MQAVGVGAPVVQVQYMDWWCYSKYRLKNLNRWKCVMIAFPGVHDVPQCTPCTSIVYRKVFSVLLL